MPVVNVRNDQQGVLLNTEFVRKQDHIYVASMLPGLLNSMGGIRDAWIFNKAQITGADQPYNVGIASSLNLAFTLTAGAVAILTTANVDNPISRHGHMANTRLGEVNTFGMFAGTGFNANISGIDNHIALADVGMTAFIGFYLPATAVAPGVGASKALFGKWDADTNNRSWLMYWNNSAGTIRLNVALSVNGIAAVNFQSSFNFTPGNSYFIGFSFIAGTSVTIFFNDQFETFLVGVPASIFASAADITVARAATPLTPLAGPDAYYILAGLSNLRWSSSFALSFYRFIQPILLYNTDLGST